MHASKIWLVQEVFAPSFLLRMECLASFLSKNLTSVPENLRFYLISLLLTCIFALVGEVLSTSQFIYRFNMGWQDMNVTWSLLSFIWLYAISWNYLCVSTGARCVGTLLHEMKRRGKDCRFGVVSMCIGTLSLSPWCIGYSRLADNQQCW